ncbi:MAG: hypothetical protein M1830_006828, partial [Pleopsidium flavum]
MPDSVSQGSSGRKTTGEKETSKKPAEDDKFVTELNCNAFGIKMLLHQYSGSLLHRYSVAKHPRLSFAHEPLRETGTIRVVQVEPGSGTRNIVCNLMEVSLTDELVEYDALSYTWGRTERMKPLMCGECQVSVTGNLHKALRRLRQKDTKVTIWVD